MPYVDFSELKARLQIEDVAQNLGLKLKKEGQQLRAACPTCKQGGERALVITPAKQLFFCFPAKAGGDVIALTAHIKGLTNKEAADELAGTVATVTVQNRTVNKSRATPPQAPKAAQSSAFDPAAYCARLDPAHALLGPLMVSADTLKAFKAGYASNGQNRGRLALPITDMQGNILGYCGRALTNDEPILVFPKNFQPENVIFNWDKVRDTDVVYLSRDPIDVLMAHENGTENVIAPLGAITPTFLQVLSLWMEEKNIGSLELM